MPTYDYECGSCGLIYEVVQSIREDALSTCTFCGEPALNRVLYPPTVFDATPRTLGTLAERNTAKGTYWRDMKQEELRNSRKRGAEEIAREIPGMTPMVEKAERPFWRQTDQINPDLNKLSAQQKSNYILTGDSRG